MKAVIGEKSVHGFRWLCYCPQEHYLLHDQCCCCDEYLHVHECSHQVHYEDCPSCSKPFDDIHDPVDKCFPSVVGPTPSLETADGYDRFDAFRAFAVHAVEDLPGSIRTSHDTWSDVHVEIGLGGAVAAYFQIHPGSRRY